MNKVTVIISGISHIEDVAYTTKQKAIDHLVNEKGCKPFYNGRIKSSDVYMNEELVYMVKELEVR